ncbi:MAG: CRISPR-associated endonuclease Cas3'' [Candidatus Verstraetearchaeota archaeon]|nr:CRISPR-associated endonuclease Cas3'' [Candidatus Verstraetearchaeota archaeon]
MALMSFEGEYLVDHSVLTTTLFNKIYGKPYAKILYNKLSAFTPNEEAIYRISKLACLLHDIGKALKGYQQPAKRLSFPFHEIPSAYIFFKIARPILPENEDLLLLYSNAILTHHQAMRNFDVIIYKRDEIISLLHGKLGLPKNSEEDLKELSLAIKRHTGFSIEAETLHDALETLDIGTLWNAIEHYVIKKYVERNLHRWVAITSVPIQLCDNLAASLLRPEGSPLTRRLAFESLRLLSSKTEIPAIISKIKI